MKVIGRTHEVAIMQNLLTLEASSFLAMYGRRRIGKTYLIEEVYRKNMIFTMSGLHEVSLEEQLQNFSYTLANHTKQLLPQPKNWLEAFQMLIEYTQKIEKRKKVIFFDELPWLCSARSNFLSSLEHFWNSWAAKRTDVILVVCGSAASWMIKNIVQNKGGLHNRLTQTIRLMPFTLYETELMLHRQGVRLNRYQIAQLYMCIGGIPYYLSKVPKGKSVEQVINYLCFQKDSLLSREFEYLFQSLFQSSLSHLSVVKALSQKTSGMSRSEIIKKTKLANAGSTTRILEELEESGFIAKLTPLHNIAKDTIYRLVDFYTLFYLKYIEKTKPSTNTFVTISRSSNWSGWLGYAFENLCLIHIHQIRLSMSIAGVNTRLASWVHRGNDSQKGAQIDLVIDRDDQVITLCEIKFSKSEFEINKKYAQELRNKVDVFHRYSKSKKSIFTAMIAPFGLSKSPYNQELIQNIVTLEDLYLA